MSAAPSSVLLSSAPLVPEDGETDMDFVPAPVIDEPEPDEEVEMCSGEKEVVRVAAAVSVAALADAPSSLSGPRRSRRRHPPRGKRQSPPSGADLSSVDMDLTSEKDPASSMLIRSFDEVWHDQLTWEELRSARNGLVLKKVGEIILSVEASPPGLQFGALSGLEAFPCEGSASDEFAPCCYDSVWIILLIW